MSFGFSFLRFQNWNDLSLIRSQMLQTLKGGHYGVSGVVKMP
jgi:hypothetical protein